MAARVRVLAGVDEAGLGPLLGPLCLGFAALELPEGAGPRWALRRACASKPSSSERRVVVCDSKALHHGSRKMEALERTALPFLAAARDGKLPRTVGDVLTAGIARPQLLAELPWYRDLDAPVPVAASRREIERSTARLCRRLEKAHVAVLDAGVHVVPEAELNRLFEKTNNKSVTLFESLTPVLARLRPLASSRITIVCDRHGGRASYAPMLAAAFPGGWVSVARESRDASLYRIRVDEGTLRVAFAQKGESRSFACALGSCLAKYARELAMERWNAWFSQLAPGVKPTAGYYTDAMRYLREAEPALAAAGIRRDLMVRSR